MRGHFRKTVGALLIGGVLAGGCNIFGVEASSPESDVHVLEEELDAFLLPGSRQTITSEKLLDIAKKAREFASIGVLTITRELSQWEAHEELHFPFEEMPAAQREQIATHVRMMDRALALLLFANIRGTRARPVEAPGGDTWLRIAAERVVLVGGVEPCDFYPDFVVARLLRVMLDFRLRLDDISPMFRIVATQRGYGIRWMGTAPMNLRATSLLNDAIAELNEAIGAEVVPVFSPYKLFGCPTPHGEIIDITKVRTYVEKTLCGSLRAYFINTGEPDNPGIGDNDGDGRTDEEMVNGQDEDGDGLVDEDAHL